MSDNILPEGELLRRAVQLIADQGQCTPKIVEEASVRYNLSPNDEAFLLRTFLPKLSDE
ncbi:MAG: hypothetical protein R3E08_03980 [Thiotrichaceae bacterium]